MGERMVYINGEFIPETQAKLSVFDLGFLQSDLITEMTRTFNHKPFRLQDHLNRLYRSVWATRMPVKMTMEEMERVTLDVWEANLPFQEPGMDCAITHHITGGISPTGTVSGAIHG
jgi:branched-chain amino acid aminotransferase